MYHILSIKATPTYNVINVTQVKFLRHELLLRAAIIHGCFILLNGSSLPVEMASLPHESLTLAAGFCVASGLVTCKCVI